MKLYRIRRKDDGRFFASWYAAWNPRYSGKAVYTDKGTFFHKIETIAKHLDWLCADWKADPKIRWKQNPIISKRHPERLEQFEVVVNDVSLNGEKVLQAVDIVKKAKKK